jgi:hypothetical protein
MKELLKASKAREQYNFSRIRTVENILQRIDLTINGPDPSNFLDITDIFYDPRRISKDGVYILSELESLGYKIEFNKWWQQHKIIVTW